MKSFLTEDEEQKIVAAIAQVESKTSGEIHVHLSSAHTCRGGIMSDAVAIFKKLNLGQTKYRNGVVIYVSVKDRQFAIIGDCGIHDKVGDAGWNAIAQDLRQHFTKGERAQGLIAAVEAIGSVLATYFPSENAVAANELSNEISKS